MPQTSTCEKTCFNIKLFIIYAEFIVPYYYKLIPSIKKKLVL